MISNNLNATWYKTPWRDGTMHLVMSPLEFMQRLAALVPRPRLHLIRLVSA
jgi:Putative transposase